MKDTTCAFEPRPIDEVQKELLGREKAGRNPFIYAVCQDVEPVIAGLRSVDRERWAGKQLTTDGRHGYTRPERRVRT